MSNIVQYSKTEAALAELRTKYSKPFDVSTTSGMAEARAARAEIRKYRTDLEKMRVELKAPVLQQAKDIDAEAKRITADLEALETPIDDTIKKEEIRKEAERAAEEEKKLRAQREALALSNRMRDSLTWAYGRSSTAIADCLQGLESQVVPANEYTAEVEAVRDQVRAQLRTLQAKAIEQEAEAFRAAEDRAELDRLRAEAARQEAERKAKAEAEAQEAAKALAAERAKIDAEVKFAEEKLRAEAKKAQAEREAADAAAAKSRAEEDRKAREAREKEEARLRAERAKLDAEREEADALAKKAKEEAEAAKMRSLSGRALLEKFIDDHHDDEEFREIVVAINAWLNKSHKKTKGAA